MSRQLEDCEKLASVRGWQVTMIYRENDKSASGGQKRPKFDAMLAGVKNGAYDAVIAWNLDRLTRNRRDTLRLIEAGQEAKLTISLARGSDLDMSTPMGRMMADQLAGWARYEIDQKGDRQKRANLQRAEAGLPHAGRRAFGYTTDGMSVIEDEALILKDIAHRYLNGWSFNEIAWHLNAQGYKTVMGKRFVGVAIRQLLQRERYVGRRTYEGVTIEGKWPAIFDEDTFARLQYAIRSRSYLKDGQPKNRRYLLTGLLTCGDCGYHMHGTRQKVHGTEIVRTTYRCKRQGTYERESGGCGRVSRGSVPLEHFLKELIIYRLDTGELNKLVTQNGRGGERVASLLNRRAALDARLGEILDDYSDGVLSRIEFKRVKSRTDAALVDVQTALDALHSSEAVNGLLSAGESVRERWDAETDGWKRQLIELLIEKITINHSPKKPRYFIDGLRFYFDTEAVDVRWRV